MTIIFIIIVSNLFAIAVVVDRYCCFHCFWVLLLDLGLGNVIRWFILITDKVHCLFFSLFLLMHSNDCGVVLPLDEREPPQPFHLPVHHSWISSLCFVWSIRIYCRHEVVWEDAGDNQQNLAWLFRRRRMRNAEGGGKLIWGHCIQSKSHTHEKQS